MKLYLYEGLNAQDRHSMILWESAGRKLVEAQLTADQITQLFQQIEQGATGAGGNRTALGLTKDAGTAVMKAYNDLKTKVANSGPIKNIDSMYDQAAEKLKQATGGDQGVMQYVQKYRDFAKAHPIAQSFIYGALIAAAGITGAGVGGAAALGLFKMVDKLLQGEKFSSAAYQGAKTGAMAYAAGQIGKAIKGDQAPPPGSDKIGAQWEANQAALSKDLLKNYTPVDFKYVPDGLNINIYDKATGKLVKMVDLANSDFAPGVDPETFIASMGRYGKAASSAASKASRDAANAAFDAAHPNFESRNLTRKQVTAIFERVARLNNRMLSEGRLQEGIWDDIKAGTGKAIQGAKNLAGRAVGAVAQKAQTIGHNLTTKVTADKLNKAWAAAGSPTDSAAIEQILQQAGVNPDVIKTVFQANNIPVSAVADTPMPDVMSTNRTAGRLPDVSKLTPAQKQQLIALIDKRLAELTTPVKTTKPKVPYSSIKKSTDTAPTVTTPTKVAAPRNPGAPTQAEQDKLQQKIQAALAAQQK